MNKIDQLLKKYCPNGAEEKPLWEIVDFDKRFKGVDKNKQKNILKFKHVSAAQLKAYPAINNCTEVRLLSTGIYDGYTQYNENDKNINYGEIISIPSGGDAILKYYKGYFIDSLNILLSSKNIEEWNLKFIFYSLINKINYIKENFTGSSIKHPNMRVIVNTIIPIPPIKIQNKIVEILDNFSELEAELEAELEFRNIQYEHYNNKLLDFDNNQSLLRKLTNGNFLNKEVKSYKLLEVAKINTGQFITKTSLLDFGLYYVYNGSNKPFGKINKYNAAKYSSTIVRCGSAGVVNFLQDNAWVSDNSYIVEVFDKNFLSPKYLNYFLKSNQKFFMEKVNFGSVPRLPKHVLQNLFIPIPSLEIQNRIVRVLEKLETYNKDVNTGLPAELNARKSQYDYYLNKLLTFKTGGGNR